MAIDLDKIRKKHEEVKQKMKSKGGNFKDLALGDNKMRFCSPSDPSVDFYKEAGYHYLQQGKETKAVLCLKLTYGEECYLCDVVSSLYKSKEKGDKELAGRIRASMRIFYNIIDRDDENKLKVLVTGNSIFKDLLGFIGDVEWGDLTDQKTGHDVTVTKTKTGEKKTDIEYEVKPSPKVTQVEYSDEDLTDLDELVGKDYVTYEQQEAIFEGKEVPDDERVSRDGTPKADAKPAATKPAAPAVRKPATAPAKPKMTPEEERILAKVNKVDLTIPKALKAFNNWKANDGSEAGLDKLIEFYGIEEDPEPASEDASGATEEAAEQSGTEDTGGDLDDQIQKALAKYKKPAGKK